MEKFVPYSSPPPRFWALRLHVGELRVPSSSPDDDVAAQRQHRADVFDGRFRSGEVDDNIDAGQVGSRQRRGMRIVVDVERAHAVAALPRHLGHQAAGFSLAQNENQHVFLRNSSWFTVLSSQLHPISL